ncbi:MAG: site-specific integrase [Chloroflexi bacterium]|nr:site-specific integrase [Chloroflexota bacterium]
MTDDDRGIYKPKRKNKQLTLPGALEKAGAAANQAAARHRFTDYKMRRADETLRRQKTDLELFGQFLEELQVNTGNLFDTPEAWQGVTWGLVEAFLRWQMSKGYALSSINVRLSTIKAFSRMVMQAGFLPPEEYALIRSIQGYTQKEQIRIDQRRQITRIGAKKASSVQISREQARLLKKAHANSPQGRRDALMMCLLLDHGLRVGEVAALSGDNLDLAQGTLRFYRSKVSKVQIHRLTGDTHTTARAYADFGDLPDSAPLLRRSKKNEKLGKAGMSERAITQRVKFLGEKIGLMGLSAHDCRHYWATAAARHGTDPFTLQEAGGWASLAMPRRYIDDNDIANAEVKLD